MNAHRRFLFLLMPLLILAACLPNLNPGDFQRLYLAFRLGEDIPADEETLVHSSAFLWEVEARKQWVGISGRLSPPAGMALPNKVTVDVEVADLDSGQVSQRLSLSVSVANDGAFEAKKKLKKNIEANSSLTVSVKPQNEDLVAGTDVKLCFDLVAKKGDLADLADDCIGSGGGGGGGGAATLSQLQSEIFTPSCATSGCHSAGSAQAGLVLASGQTHGETVQIASSQRPELALVEPGSPNQSYLLKKIRGDSDIQGDEMPRGSGSLSQAQIDAVTSWIQAGAQDN